MDQLSNRALLLLHLHAIEGYLTQLVSCDIPDELKENMEEINKARSLFVEKIMHFSVDFSELETNAVKVLCHDLRNYINGIGGYTELCLNLVNELGYQRLQTPFQTILIINNQLLQLVDGIYQSSAPEISIEITENSEEPESQTTGGVLIVEDNQANRDLLYNWLSAKGYQVYKASNGDDALALLQTRTNIDVVLLDILMTGKDGITVLKEIRSNKNYSEISIIMLTALNDIDNIVRCVKMGAEDYLIKPFNSYLLAAKIQASIERKLLRSQNLAHARQVGKADVTMHVLHNVGNFLNSVTVAASLISEKIKKSEISELLTIKEVLDGHKQNLPDFLITDERGRAIPAFVCALADYWQKEQSSILMHLDVLNEKIQHINDIVGTQQSWGQHSSLIERIDLAEVIDSALAIQEEIIDSKRISVQRNYIPLNPVFIDKVKLLHILVNLIINAQESFHDSEQQHKLITINIVHSDNHLIVQVIDNGMGIAREHVTKIFSQGFTTKKNGHGLGLHGSALAARECGGRLTVESDGFGKGACFNLILPLTRQDQ